MLEYKIERETYGGQKVIHTTISGNLTDKERDRIAVETVRKMRADNVSLVLWDIRAAKLTYSLIGSHMVVLNLEALGLGYEDRVAVIYFHNKEQHEHARTVAHNRNMTNLDYFQDFNEGIDWLTKKG